MKSIGEIFFTFFFLIFMSCQSGRMQGEDSLLVMVYDLGNNTVKDVAITVDGKEYGKTDVYGRFAMPIPINDEGEEHEIVISKNGYSTVGEKITYNPSIVLYYKIGSYRQYMEKAEKEVDKGDLRAALRDVNLAVDIEPRDDALFLKAIILGMTGDVDGAEEVLLDLRENERLESYTGKEVSRYGKKNK